MIKLMVSKEDLLLLIGLCTRETGIKLFQDTFNGNFDDEEKEEIKKAILNIGEPTEECKEKLLKYLTYKIDHLVD